MPSVLAVMQFREKMRTASKAKRDGFLRSAAELCRGDMKEYLQKALTYDELPPEWTDIFLDKYRSLDVIYLIFKLI